MTKLLKLMGYLLLILIIVVLSSALLLKHLVKSTQLLSHLQQSISARTGLQVELKGQVSLSYWPILALKFHQIQIDNSPQFIDSSPLLKINKLTLHIRLLPLFLGQLRFSQLTLQHPTLNLLTLPSGNNNWRYLSNPPAIKKPIPVNLPSNNVVNTAKAANQSSSANLQDTLWITAIDIKQGQINWNNQQTQQLSVIKHINLNARYRFNQHLFPIILSFQWQHLKPRMGMSVQAQGDGMLDLQTHAIGLKSFIIIGKISHFINPTTQAMPLKLQGQLLLNPSTQLLKLNDFSLQLANLKATGNLIGSHLQNAPLFKGKLQIQPFNLRQWLQAVKLSPGLSNPQALSKFSAQFNFLTSPKFTKLSALKFTLDNTNGYGNINITNFTQLNTTFDLHLNQLNMNNYASSSSNVKLASNCFFIPCAYALTINNNHWLNWLGQQRFDGSLDINRLSWQKLQANNVQLKTLAKHNLVTVSPINADFYQGKLNGAMTFDLSGTQPAIKSTITLKGMQLSQLLNAIRGSSHISAITNLSAHLSTKGFNKTAWLASLNGSGEITMSQGEIYGLKSVDNVRQKLAQLQNKSAPSESNARFSKLQASFNIASGILQNNDLSISNHKTHISGKGKINLNNGLMKYQIIATIQHDSNPKNAWVLPIAINGPILHPEFTPNYIALGKILLQTDLQKQINDKLKDLFK